MVVAPYGSHDVVNLIIHLSYVDANHYCGMEKTTTRHCVALGGSMNAIKVVEIFLSIGADPNCINASDDCPINVITVPCKLFNVKVVLEDLHGAMNEIHY